MPDFDRLFSQFRDTPWRADPNGVPQEGLPGNGNPESSGWISDGAITADTIQANAVTAGKVDADAITAREIAANTITANEVAANTITANEIAANTITGNEIAANTITASEIAANAVTANEIAANTITANEIAASAITASELAANSVITEKILAGNVVSSKIELTVSGKNFGANSGSESSPGVFFDADSTTGMSYSTALGAPTLIFAAGAGLQTAITSTQLQNWGDVIPGTDNTYDSGTTARRWATVYRVAESAVSDARYKRDIADAPLGLEFVRSLRPRVFRWKDTPDTQAREAATPGAVDQGEIQQLTQAIEDARALQNTMPTDDPRHIEAEGIVEMARARLSEIHEQHDGPLRAARQKRRPGRRLHYGFIAQEVKAALDAAGIDSMDAGFWQESPEGDQSLSYSEMMIPLVRAIQEMADRITAMELSREKHG